MVVRLNHLPTPLKAKASGRTDTSHDSTAFLNLAGDNSEEATPDPIPNSEVKLFCVDGTAWEAMWESRSSPAFFLPFCASSASTALLMWWKRTCVRPHAHLSLLPSK